MQLPRATYTGTHLQDEVCVLLQVSALLGALQVNAATPAVPANRWNVDFGEESCALSRRVSDASSPVVTFWSPFGGVRPRLAIIGGDRALMNELGRANAVVLGEDDRLPIQVERYDQPRGAIALMRDLPEDFTQRVASSSRLRIMRGNRTVLELRMPGAAEAVRVLQTCNDDLLASWGIDMQARSTMRQRAEPELPVASAFTSASYPHEALMNRQQGQSVAVLTISAEGQPTACRIVRSSRSESLDGATCRVLMSRTRWRPALDASGRPTVDQEAITLTWVIPQ